ncbi:MAG: hypothetical protein AAF764_12300 [Pseudomonadota bacterium]
MRRPALNISQRLLISCGTFFFWASAAMAGSAPLPASDIPDGFFPVELEQPQRPAPTLLAALGQFAPNGPEGPEGRYSGGMLIVTDGDRYRIDSTEEGYLDDSVKGRVVIAYVAYRDGGWVLEEVHRKWLCRRGEPNAKGLCP